MDVELLHDNTFNTVEVLRKFILDYASCHGFKIAIISSNKRAIYYKCSSSSNCPYRLTAYFCNDKKIWKLKVKNASHNHSQVDLTLQKSPVEYGNLQLKIIKMHTTDNLSPTAIQLKLSLQSIHVERKFIYNTLRNYKKRVKRRASK